MSNPAQGAEGAETMTAASGEPGRAAFAQWSSLQPEFQDRIWASMSDDVRAFWARQEDDQAVAAILATPDAKILAGVSAEHMDELRAERDGAVHKARVQAAIREAIADSSTVDFHGISDDGVTSLAILATHAALASPRADSDERTAGEVWGVEENDRFVWVGILRPDRSKIDHIVYHIDMGGYTPEAKERRRADARRIVAAMNATPAQPAGAVPDSLRALSEEEIAEALYEAVPATTASSGRQLSWSEVKTLTGHPYPLLVEGHRKEARAVLALLASHPAGQSAGSGVARTVEFMCEGQVCTAEVSTPRPAPDSTRTGPVSFEPAYDLASDIAAKVMGLPWASSENLDIEGLDERYSQIQGIAAAALAARPAAPEAQGAEISQAARDVLAERRRQVEAEGWSPEHDDGHSLGELGLAGALYALPYDARVGGEPLIEQDHHIGLDMALEIACGWRLKPDTDPRRRLVKSGALILAEIERRDRLPAPPAPSGQEG